MRARVFLQDQGAWRFACELDAKDADDVWRQLEANPLPAGRRLAEGDVVYVGDLYWKLDGDGGWGRIAPGRLTRELYRLAGRRT